MQKLTLVPYDAVASHQQSYNSAYFRPTLDRLEPTVYKIKSLQDDMQRLLADENLSEDEKAKILTQVQGTFDTHLKRYRDSILPVPSTTTPPSTATTTATATATTSSSSQSPSILSTIPKTYQTKASHVLGALQKHPDLKINDKQEIVVKGTPIQGSNVVDLLLETTTPRKKNINLTGLPLFKQLIRDVNVPRSLLDSKAAVYDPDSSPSTYRNSRTPPRLSPVTKQSWETFPSFPK